MTADNNAHEPSRAFRIGPIRPPSEADSLLLQVTRGCTWNRCRFCTVYRGTKFKAFSADSVKEDIDAVARCAEDVRRYAGSGGDWDLEGLNRHLAGLSDEDERQSFATVANWLMAGGENVFLQDGNTTALSSGRLADVLIYLKQVFPQIRRITSYGRAENLARHDADYYAELREAGLDRIHSGFESGSDAVLQLINKGCTSEQEITAGRNVRAGGIELSVYFMPGIGGKALSRENAEGTARVLNEVTPEFLRIRTAAVKPGTPLYEDHLRGEYCLCGDDDKVREIRRVVELCKGNPLTLVSDHMVNLLQHVEGKPSNEFLAVIDDYLRMSRPDRRVYQLLRRTLRAAVPADIYRLPGGQLDELRRTVMEQTEEAWDGQMNALIGRYI